VNTVGGITLLWSVVWFFVAYDVPSEHPRICRAELDYLTAVVPQSAVKKVSQLICFPRIIVFLPFLPPYAASKATGLQ